MVVSDTAVALVTGAARRIGAEIVRQLHQSGLHIVLHYRNSDKEAQALADNLNAQRPDSVRLVQGDIAESDDVPGIVQNAIDHYGRLDVIVNNASAFYPTAIGEITEQDWNILIGSNLKGPLFMAQAAAQELRRNHGCIINIVDIHAERPLKNYPVYSVAKAGLAALTKSLARELAPEVRVNGVSPGAILWPEAPHFSAQHQEIIERTALKREGTPADIARTVAFLVLDAPYITGQIIAVDGGRTLSN